VVARRSARSRLDEVVVDDMDGDRHEAADGELRLEACRLDTLGYALSFRQPIGGCAHGPTLTRRPRDRNGAAR
jgi:hypothetical protein